MVDVDVLFLLLSVIGKKADVRRERGEGDKERELAAFEEGEKASALRPMRPVLEVQKAMGMEKEWRVTMEEGGESVEKIRGVLKRQWVEKEKKIEAEVEDRKREEEDLKQSDEILILLLLHLHLQLHLRQPLFLFL